MLKQYFSLRDDKASAPNAAAWIKALQDMIDENGDRMQIFQSGIGCNWLYAVEISTAEVNFTDDVKKSIVPQMCDPAMNLGPCWQEIDVQGFRNLKAEIDAVKREKSREEAEYQRRLAVQGDRSDGYYAPGMGRSKVNRCNHQVGFCNCR